MCSMFIISTYIYSCFCLFLSYHSLYRILAIPTLYKLNSPHMFFLRVPTSLCYWSFIFTLWKSGFRACGFEKKTIPSNRSFVGSLVGSGWKQQRIWISSTWALYLGSFKNAMAGWGQPTPLKSAEQKWEWNIGPPFFFNEVPAIVYTYMG